MNLKIKRLITTSAIGSTIFLLSVTSVFAVLNSSAFLPKAQDFINKNCSKKNIDNQASLFCYLFYKTGELENRVSTLEQPATTITVNNGWGHFTRLYEGQPTPLDPTSIAVYATINNAGTKNDLLIGAYSTRCHSFSMQDMGISGGPGTGDIPSIAIPVGGNTKLELGGFRMICNGASGFGLDYRGQFPIVFIFDKYGEVPVTIQVQETPQ